MQLDKDGITPLKYPDRNRPVAGLKGISNLWPGNFSTQYFEVLIKHLKGIGYTQENLMAASYDWRVAPAALESRYQYFSNLKKSIEDFRKKNNQRVVLLGHSLGNRIVQYFLGWQLGQDGGKAWIDDHIARYLAVSSLWLGVPKSIHEALADLGHLGLMAINGVKPLYQSYSALPWMLPVTAQYYRYMNTESFAFLEDDQHPLSIDEAWQLGSAHSVLNFKKRFYENDPLYTIPGGPLGSRMMEPPYVENIEVLHGSSQPTEIGAYYKRAAKKTLVVKTDATSGSPEFEVLQGVRYETPGRTQQYIDGTFNSGDGFLPYGSLMFYKTWNNSYPERKISGTCFAGATHYNVLSNPDFLKKITSLVYSS
jgi:pimeloyl-ACP methyl ester carboxylesterase